MSIYFDKIQNHVELTCQFSTGDIRDFITFYNTYIRNNLYKYISEKKSFLSCKIDQIISCCTLSKTLLSIFEYLYQQHGLIVSNK